MQSVPQKPHNHKLTGHRNFLFTVTRQRLSRVKWVRINPSEENDGTRTAEADDELSRGGANLFLSVPHRLLCRSGARRASNDSSWRAHFREGGGARKDACR